MNLRRRRLRTRGVRHQWRMTLTKIPGKDEEDHETSAKNSSGIEKESEYDIMSTSSVSVKDGENAYYGELLLRGDNLLTISQDGHVYLLKNPNIIKKTGIMMKTLVENPIETAKATGQVAKAAFLVWTNTAPKTPFDNSAFDHLGYEISSNINMETDYVWSLPIKDIIDVKLQEAELRLYTAEKVYYLYFPIKAVASVWYEVFCKLLTGKKVHYWANPLLWNPII